MNTTHGIAVSPPSRRTGFAIAAGQLMVALLVLAFTFGAARAADLNPEQPIQFDGLEIFFGFIPAEILRGHPRAHEEQTMHGGVPRGKGVHHLLVSVFAAKTRERMTNAVITGTVTRAGMATQSQKLEAMAFGGAVSYGNYFAMPEQGPYEIVVSVRRPGAGAFSISAFALKNAGGCALECKQGSCNILSEEASCVKLN